MNSTTPHHQVIPIKAFRDNYIWLYHNIENHASIIVDPGDAKPVIEALSHSHFDLKAILITHHHYDHTGGVTELQRRYHIPVFGPKCESIKGVTEGVEEGNLVSIPEINSHFEVLDVHAHTNGHIAYYGDGILFCGDTLFSASCGRIFEGTADDMFKALSKLADLPGDTKIYCAHEYTESNLAFASAVEPKNTEIQNRIVDVAEMRAKNQPSLPSTIEIEKATNPFLRTKISTVKNAAEAFAGKKLVTPVDVLAALRAWKDEF